MEIADIWQKIEVWYSTNAPEGNPGLRAGASVEEINAAEKMLGIELPSDVRSSYEIHNGSTNALFPMGYYLLSLEEIVDEHDVWCGLLSADELPQSNPESVGPIKQVWWSPRWIPITHSGGGDHDCIDLEPAVGGAAGQIIVFDHERGPRRVSATNFTTWLQEFSNSLLQGELQFDGSKLVYIEK